MWQISDPPLNGASLDDIFNSDHLILHLEPPGLLSEGNYLLVEWFSPGHIWTFLNLGTVTA